MKKEKMKIKQMKVQEFSPWIKSKDEFNELQNCMLSVNNLLKTSTDKYQYNFIYMKELIKNITNNKITKNNTINRVKVESSYIDEIKILKGNANTTTIINFNRDLIQLFGPDYFDKQTETTDMPDLECEESSEQEGQGLKILTPNQMLSRQPITLAQLKRGNNSERLRNETRPLLYSLYRSKKLSKTIYNGSINTI